MSNYYDFKCLDCDTHGPFDNANRGHRQLLSVLKLRPELEALGLADQRLRKSEPDGWYESREYGDSVPSVAVFLAQHVGHVVVVKSEYGHDAFFGCEKLVDENYRYEAKERENRVDCRLDANHEGPCSRTRPDGK